MPSFDAPRPPLTAARLFAVLLAVVCCSPARAADRQDTISLSPEMRKRCLDTLRKALRSEEFWPSMHAAEALTQAGHGDETLAALRGRLDHETDDQRRCGLAREQVRAGDRALVPVMLDILAKPDAYGHTHAAESLYKVADVGDGRRLRELMTQAKEIKLRLMASAALARCGNRDGLQRIRHALAGDDAEGRQIAAWILARIGDASDLPQLRKNLDRTNDPLVHSYMVNALACLGDPAGQQALKANLHSDDSAVQTYAAVFAGDARLTGAREALQELLASAARDVRVRAAQSLLALSQPAPAALGDVSRDVYPASAAHPRLSEGSIAPLRDGSLLYATTQFSGGGADDASAEIIARASRDGGQTWGPPRTLQANVGQRNVMSVSLRRLAQPLREDTPLGMFYLVKNGPGDLKAYLRVSRDEGQSFGPATLVTSGDGYHVMNNDRVALLSSGRLVCPVAWTPNIAKQNHLVAFTYFSDDAGRTWRQGKTRVDLAKRGAMEPDVLESSDGRLWMILRTQLGYIAACSSSDGGDTWSKPRPWPLKAPESPATIREIPSTGDWLLVWNNNFQPGAGHGGQRTPLTAAISRDSGRTWTHTKNLESDPDKSYAYTSLTFQQDRALLSYYVRDAKTGRISSRFRSLPIAWFYEPDDRHK